MENADNTPRRIAFWVIIGAALLTRLWNISNPPRVMFDEVYYATMANFYISSTPFVDTHPPVARLIFALAAFLGGSDGTTQFLTPGALYGSFPYIWLRAASGIAGIIFIALLMLFTHALTGSARAGLFAGFIAVFENALAAQSRVILPDMFLLMFGFMGLLFTIYDIRARDTKKRRLWLALAGIALGFTLGVKISGVIFIAAAIVFALAARRGAPSHPQLLMHLVVLPFAALYALTALHFALLDPNAPVLLSIGANPNARYATIFNALRTPNAATRGELIAQRFKETTLAFIALPASHLRPFHPHPAASPWFSWPFMYRPILYNYANERGGAHVVALFGNLAIWWGGLVALAWLMFRAWHGISDRRVIVPLVLSYAFALGLFAIASRELFLYLYLPALVFLIIIAAIALDTIAERSKIAAALLAAGIITIFFFFAPFTFRLPLDDHALQRRTWLPSWDFSQQK